MRNFSIPVLALSVCALALAGCSSDKTIGATAAPKYGPVGCPKPVEGGRGVFALKAGATKKATNLCLEATQASYGGKPAKIIWGTTSPLGPAIAEITSTGSGLDLVVTGGRTGTQMTLQQGSKRLAVNFNINALDGNTEAKSGEISTSTNFQGKVTIPPLRGLNYLDSRGRGSDVGYDGANAFPASLGERGAEGTKESREREVQDGKIELQVEGVNPETGEIFGKFISRQPTGLAALPEELEVRGTFIGTFSKDVK
ncbi:photosystem II manganese-stabilizing polypeptide [Anthocerotibacter panamensis]|uniref:photosystem II manganese-stabilizing polypeptide n=1 Tax=Anthocerotibacter panamensis TaxID=2857077 RepID=UPI001C402394|nr:photosystem II manganese-stabilizing polypeptide [Anthocerotibacter panamensis]